MRECTTHHHACDCREEKFKKLEAENAKLREWVEEVCGTAPRGWTDHPAISYHEVQIEKSTLAEMREWLSKTRDTGLWVP